jgi:hypothetical protein
MVACAPTSGLPSSFNYNEKKEMMHLFFQMRNLAQPFFPSLGNLTKKGDQIAHWELRETHLLPWMISPCGHTMKSSSRKIIQEKI